MFHVSKLAWQARLSLLVVKELAGHQDDTGVIVAYHDPELINH